MLSLAQAFIAKPRLLMIDELSLGLAPTVVESLLDIVKAIHENGTTVVLIEQSVNLALRLCDRAIFMEKGQVVFSGSTSELLGRDDIVRAVFLEGAKQAHGIQGGGPAVAAQPQIPADEELEVTFTSMGRDVSGLPSNRDHGREKGSVALHTEELSKRFGGVVAVDKVGFDLLEGEILGFIGPNGAGKTTVFDLVSAQLTADSGKVILHGEDISNLPAHERAAKGLGRSFQAARLWPGLTLEETVSLAVTAHLKTPGALQTLFCLPTTGRAEKKIRKIAGEVIELLGLGDFSDLLISDLSTGTRRLAELAVIVAMRPSVVLLDEPSAGIAQAESEQLIPVLKATKEHLGCSIMIVEHDMTVMKGLADRIIALDTGRVVVVGPPDEVLSHPLVVESYLGRAAATV